MKGWYGEDIFRIFIKRLPVISLVLSINSMSNFGLREREGEYSL